MTVLTHLWSALAGTGSDDVPRRRTVLFAVSVAVLLLVARAGAPTLAFALALGLFAGASALWLRGQYTRYLASQPAVAHWWAYALLLVVAAGLCATYAALLHDHRPVGGLLLAGLVLGYFAIGGLLAVWRESGRWLARVGAVLAVLAAGSVRAGYEVLRHEDTHLLFLGVALLGVGLLVFWPVAVAVLSEAATTQLSAPGVGVWRWVAMGAGFAGAIGTTAWMYADSHSAFTVYLVVALAVLTASVASSTRADIVLIIVGLALMGFTPGDADPPRPVAGKQHVLVALGDSYMSGEGASIYFRGTDSAGRDTCRRAPSAWAVQAGHQPPFDGTLFLACSGAVSANIRTSTPPGSGLPAPFAQAGEGEPQLTQYADAVAGGAFHPDLVVLSVGGNDAGFSTIGVMCLAPGNCADRASWWTGGLSDVRTSLDLTFTQVRAAFPDTPVVVTAYPDPIYRGVGDQPPATTHTKVKPCSQVALRPEERAFIATFLERLDDTVHDVADAHHFYFLGDMQYALRDAGLQLCDPANNGRPGLNFIGLRSVSGLAEQRFNPSNWSHNSLHPNESGHQAMLQTFERWLAAHPDLQVLAPAELGQDPSGVVGAGTSAPDGSTTFDPVCSPIDANPSGCRSRGTHWAADHTAEALRSVRALQVVAIEALWWVGVLGFFGWRRRRWTGQPPVNLV